jgi:hypothetical protein
VIGEPVFVEDVVGWSEAEDATDLVAWDDPAHAASVEANTARPATTVVLRVRRVIRAVTVPRPTIASAALAMHGVVRTGADLGLAPSRVADLVIDAIERRWFRVLTEPDDSA